MIAEPHPVSPASPHPHSSVVSPLHLIVFALLILLALFPPSGRGESLAGCAALIALLAALCWRPAGLLAVGQLAVVATLCVALPASWAAFTPGAAVAPLSVGVLAAAAGLAAAGLARSGDPGRGAGFVLASAAGAVSVHAIYQKAWGLNRLAAVVRADSDLPDRAALLARLEGGRAFGGFQTPAAFGGMLALALPVTLALAVAARGRARWLWIGLGGLQLCGALAAASATATVALGGALAVAGLLWGRRRISARVWSVGLVAVAVLLAGMVLQRGTTVLDPLDPESPWRLRAGNLRSAWSMSFDHPWIGVGPGGFGEAYPAYRQPGDNEIRHAHNLPLELAVELGWPAALLISALFFYLFVGPLWIERRPGPAWRRGVAIGLAAFALQNLADYTCFMPELLWTAALLRGALARPLSREARPVALSGRITAGVSLAAVVVAAVLAGLVGLSRDARFNARRAAFSGEADAAILLAVRATRLAPWDPDAAILLARTTEGSGNDRLSLERADRAVRLAPFRPGARELRARARLISGDVPGAYSDLAEAARLYPVHERYTVSRDRLRERIESWTGRGE